MSAPKMVFQPAPERTLDLRRAFGRFGTGVTVVTVDTDAGPVGMTANSFSSVSLDPPLVLWSPALSSRRHDAFARAADFCVHVLGADQFDLALHFASKGDDFDQFDWKTGPNGAPRLSGCLSVFHCATHALHPAGDHSLILGRVQEVELDDESSMPGLLFDQGRFGQFAPRDTDTGQ